MNSVITALVVMALIGTTFAAEGEPLRSPENWVAKAYGGQATEKPAGAQHEKTPTNETAAVNKVDAKPADKGRNNSQEATKTENLLVWCTGLLVVVGFVQAAILWLTIRAINRQTSMNGEIERAWITVQIGEIEEPKKDGEVCYVLPRVKNVGKTPARLLKFCAAKRIVPKDQALPPTPEYRGEKAVDVILAPVNDPVRPWKFELSYKEFSEVRKGARQIYIYGFVDYADIGGNYRKTRFCCGLYVPPASTDPIHAGFYQAIDVPPAYIAST